MFGKILDQDRDDNQDFDHIIQDFISNGVAWSCVSPGVISGHRSFRYLVYFRCGVLGDWNHICWECEFETQ